MTDVDYTREDYAHDNGFNTYEDMAEYNRLFDTIETLTPEQWWKAAPWQDIESLIPYDNVILGDDENIEKGFIGECGFFYKSYPISPSPPLGFKPTKWLPLPQETNHD